MTDDATLLRDYATSRSEHAFAELARRHLPMVYSAALRASNGDAHRAADVAQIVFSSVARDAARLSRHPVLTGWLYTATRHAAIDAARAELRRRRREQHAHNMEENSMQSEQAGMWERLRPVLDDALEQLKDDDRQAVLLRFFQARTFGEIAAALGSSEEAARKRVERSVEKLREVLQRRGIDSTDAALGAVLAAETISAAPAGLLQTITGTALTNAAATAVGASFLAMTKFQIGVAAVVAAGGGWLMISQSQQAAALNQSLAAQQQVVSALRAENEQLRQQARDREAFVAKIRLSQPQHREPTRLSSGTTELAIPPSDHRPSESGDDAARTASKAQLHKRYGPFLEQRGLSREQMDRFVELLQQQWEARSDLQAAVEQAGAQGGTKDVEALRSQLYAPITKELREILGHDGYIAYTDFARTSSVRGGLQRLEQDLAAQGAPLSTEQADKLVRLILGSMTQVRVKPTDLGTRAEVNWSVVVGESSTVLSPVQLKTLEAFVSRQRSHDH